MAAGRSVLARAGRLALLLCLASAAAAQQTCAEGQEGTCNECICCCVTGGLLMYKPVNCGCKLDYTPSFIASMVLAGVTLLLTLVSGCYFNGNGRFSPFKPPAAQDPLTLHIPLDPRTAVYSQPSLPVPPVRT